MRHNHSAGPIDAKRCQMMQRRRIFIERGVLWLRSSDKLNGEGCLELGQGCGDLGGDLKVYVFARDKGNAVVGKCVGNTRKFAGNMEGRMPRC